MEKRKIKIAVLVSGGGTNLQAILDYQQAGKLKNGEVVAVIASNPNAYALKRAENFGVQGFVVSRKGLSQKDFENGIISRLEEVGAEVIVLAGFKSILSAEFTK